MVNFLFCKRRLKSVMKQTEDSATTVIITEIEAKIQELLKELEVSFPKNSPGGNEVCQGVIRKLSRDGMKERGS